jgi:quercetin dioxygenase-like cupin family protein
MNKLSLDAIAREQIDSALRTSAGHGAETVYGGHEKVLRQTVIALRAGSALSEHDNPGDATLLVLHGRVTLTAGELSWEGRRGDLLVVPQARHSVLAHENSAFLLSAANHH